MPKKYGWEFMDWIQFLVLVLLLLVAIAILAIMITAIVRVEQLTDQAGNFLHSGSPVGTLLNRLFNPSH